MGDPFNTAPVRPSVPAPFQGDSEPAPLGYGPEAYPGNPYPGPQVNRAPAEFPEGRSVVRADDARPSEVPAYTPASAGTWVSSDGRTYNTRTERDSADDRYERSVAESRRAQSTGPVDSETRLRDLERRVIMLEAGNDPTAGAAAVEAAGL